MLHCSRIQAQVEFHRKICNNFSPNSSRFTWIDWPQEAQSWFHQEHVGKKMRTWPSDQFCPRETSRFSNKERAVLELTKKWERGTNLLTSVHSSLNSSLDSLASKNSSFWSLEIDRFPYPISLSQLAATQATQALVKYQIETTTLLGGIRRYRWARAWLNHQTLGAHRFTRKVYKSTKNVTMCIKSDKSLLTILN